LLLLACIQSCDEKSHVETKNVAADALKILDTPFHFLLKIPGYEPNRLTHDADMFSAWGELSLIHKGNATHARSLVQDELVRAAKAAGWSVAKDLMVVDSPDLKAYGLPEQKEDLAFAQTQSLPGQKPPTRYSCRIWLSSDGSLVLAAYRVDAE
jgi:hypothetical protein